MEKKESPVRAITALQRRETRRRKQKAQMGHERNESSLATNFQSKRRTRRRRKRIREMKAKKRDENAKKSNNEDGNDDDKGEVERRIRALQRIVPGGKSLGMDMDKLFEQTAGYILALQYQVKAMKVLANFSESLLKENKKLGG